MTEVLLKHISKDLDYHSSRNQRVVLLEKRIKTIEWQDDFGQSRSVWILLEFADKLEAILSKSDQDFEIIFKIAVADPRCIEAYD